MPLTGSNSQTRSQKSNTTQRSLEPWSMLPPDTTTAPSVANRMMSPNTSTTQSFTHKKKQMERQRHNDQRRHMIDQGFLLFMARLQEHFAEKQAGPSPHKSPESIMLNISDSYFLPTALTSDMTAESEHNYSDLAEDQTKPPERETITTRFSQTFQTSLVDASPSKESHVDDGLRGNQDDELPSHTDHERQLDGKNQERKFDGKKQEKLLPVRKQDRKLEDSSQEQQLHSNSKDWQLNGSSQEKQLDSNSQERKRNAYDGFNERQLNRSLSERRLSESLKERQHSTIPKERQLSRSLTEQQLNGRPKEQKLTASFLERQFNGINQERQLASSVKERQHDDSSHEIQLAGSTQARKLDVSTRERQLNGGSKERKFKSNTQERQITGRAKGRQLTVRKPLFVSQVPKKKPAKTVRLEDLKKNRTRAHRLWNPTTDIKQPSSTLYHDHRPKNQGTYANTSKLSKTKAVFNTHLPDTHSVDGVKPQMVIASSDIVQLDEHKTNGPVLGPDVTHKQSPQKRAISTGKQKSSSCTTQLIKKDTPLKCRGDASRKLNMRALRKALTIVERSMQPAPSSSGVCSVQSVVTDQLVIDRQVRREQPERIATRRYNTQQKVAILSQNGDLQKEIEHSDTTAENRIGTITDNEIGSKKGNEIGPTIENVTDEKGNEIVSKRENVMDSKKENRTGADSSKENDIGYKKESYTGLRNFSDEQIQTENFQSFQEKKTLIRRSSSLIPVKMKTQSCKKVVKEGKKKGQIRHESIVRARSVNTIDMIVSSNKRQAGGREVCISHLPRPVVPFERTVPFQPTVSSYVSADRTVSVVDRMVEPAMINKPPLPNQALHSNMLSVKPQMSKLQTKREHSMTISGTKFIAEVTSMSFPSPVENTQTSLWTEQMPLEEAGTIRKSAPSREFIKFSKQIDGSTLVRPSSSCSTSQESMPGYASQWSSSSVSNHNSMDNINLLHSKECLDTNKPRHQMLARTNRKKKIPHTKTRRSQSQPESVPDERYKHDFLHEVKDRNLKHKRSQSRVTLKQNQSKLKQASVSANIDQNKDIREHRVSKQKVERYSRDKKRTPVRNGVSNSDSESLTGSAVLKPKGLSSVTSKRRESGRQVCKNSTKTSTYNKERCHTLQDQHATIPSASYMSKDRDRSQIHNPASKPDKPRSKQTNSHSKLPKKSRPSQNSEKVNKKGQSVCPVVHTRCGPSSETSSEDGRNSLMFDNYYGNNYGRGYNKDWDFDYTDSDSDSFCTENSPASYGDNLYESDRDETRREEKKIPVAWNMSESDVLVHSSRRRFERKGVRARTGDKIIIDVPNNLKSKAEFRQRSKFQVRHEMLTRLNKQKSLPDRLEPICHVSEDSMSTWATRIVRNDQPPEGGNVACPWTDKIRLKARSQIKTSPGSPARSQPPSNPEPDVDEKIQADMEEVLTQVYQSHCQLIERVITLQGDVKRLRNGLSLIRPGIKTTANMNFKWKGTWFDYFMLIGFMVLQFSIQYALLNK